MEDLIEKMKVDEKDIDCNKIAEDRSSASPRMAGIRRESTEKSDTSRLQRDNSEEGVGNDSTLFTGGAFLKSLINEARPVMHPISYK